MTDSKNEISALCVSCGMCCDGTLFATAFVGDEADRINAENSGLKILEIKDKLFFPLPCRHFSSCCDIYAQVLPRTCSSFFCPPVKKHKRGEQTFPETEQQIHLLKEQRNKLLKIASGFPELEHLNFRELKNKLEESAEDDEKVGSYGMLFLTLFILNNIQTKYFTPAKEDTLLV